MIKPFQPYKKQIVSIFKSVLALRDTVEKTDQPTWEHTKEEYQKMLFERANRNYQDTLDLLQSFGYDISKQYNEKTNRETYILVKQYNDNPNYA